MTPESDPASPAQKPGWKSSEYWLSVLAVVLGAVLASGAIPDDSGVMKVLGVIASILGALGYQVSRTIVKASGNKAAAFVEAARVAGAPTSGPQ